MFKFFINLFVFLTITSTGFAETSGLKDIIKSQQEKVIYFVEDFKVIYCKVCKKDPEKKPKKLCENCICRELERSLEDTLLSRIHLFS